MTIHTEHYFDRPDLHRIRDAGDILWIVGTGLAVLGLSPLFAIYLLLFT